MRSTGISPATTSTTKPATAMRDGRGKTHGQHRAPSTQAQRMGRDHVGKHNRKQCSRTRCYPCINASRTETTQTWRGVAPSTSSNDASRSRTRKARTTLRTRGAGRDRIRSQSASRMPWHTAPSGSSSNRSPQRHPWQPRGMSQSTSFVSRRAERSCAREVTPSSATTDTSPLAGSSAKVQGREP